MPTNPNIDLSMRMQNFVKIHQFVLKSRNEILQYMYIIDNISVLNLQKLMCNKTIPV